MKLRHNVATSPYENHRPFLVAAALLGSLALITLMILSRETYTTWHSNLELRADTARLERQIEADTARQQELDSYFHTPQAQQILGKADFLNSLISERTFPWTKIFMDLEKTLPTGVHVVSIAPKLVNGHAEVTMVVGAASDQSKIEFLQAMEKSPSFSNVTVNDERANTQAGEEITISLSFQYATT